MRFRPVGLLLSTIVVTASACSMDATAPASPAPSATATRELSTWSGTDWSGSDASVRPLGTVVQPTDSTYVVTIDPQRPYVLRFGAYTLDLPANTICNADAGYGLDLFDLDCKTEKATVTITAQVTPTANGLPRIDLYPEIRFSPKREVTLSLSVADAPMRASPPRILYCPSTSTPCVDEALLDPTLATQVDAATNTVFRRIKHFSGYWVEW